MHQELRLTLANDLGALARVNEQATEFLERAKIAAKAIYTTNLALEEILSNVIRHGYEDGARHEIAVTISIRDGVVELDVADDAREFDPLSAPAVDLGVPLEDRQAGRLGIHLLRTLTREIRYRRVDGENRLHVRI
jgi:anti-sigma regulatory factor (Ser/Thr protein kinase)